MAPEGTVPVLLAAAGTEGTVPVLQAAAGRHLGGATEAAGAVRHGDRCCVNLCVM